MCVKCAVVVACVTLFFSYHSSLELLQTVCSSQQLTYSLKSPPKQYVLV